MQQSIGRHAEPTTEVGEPDAREPDDDVRARVRDVLPPVGYEDTAFTDTDTAARPGDPLDLHRPSRQTGDPLDPGGHII
jgi:hypothetical protein